MFATLLLSLAATAFSQNPPAAAPATSTDTAVAVSSGTPEATGQGVHVGQGQPAAVLKNPITVRMHKESADWDPVGVRVGGDPGQASNSFKWRIKKGKGQSSKATASARLHAVKDDKMLVIALYPAGLKKRGVFMEVRCLISEGWLDAAKVAAVTVHPGGAFRWGSDDSFTLAKKGVEFSEDFPSEGDLKISALNPKPGKGNRNSGKVSGADFGGNAYDKDALRVVSFSYNAAGVAK
jgi:hypothetical protein